MTITPIFAWYDLWIGVFVDRTKNKVYIFLIPCFGFVVDRNRRRRSKRGPSPFFNFMWILAALCVGIWYSWLVAGFIFCGMIFNKAVNDYCDHKGWFKE